MRIVGFQDSSKSYLVQEPMMFFRNRNKLELHLELYEDWKMMDMRRSKKVRDVMFNALCCDWLPDLGLVLIT